MPWKARHPGDFPTLGWEVLDWIETYLAAPDRTDPEPLVLTEEQRRFVVSFYALTLDGKRKFRRAVYSRPKGSGKSPLLAALACVEALGPVLFDGWDSEGDPVGKPWSEIRTPWVQLAAVSEDQTKNAWSPLLEMMREGDVLDAYPGVEAMESHVNLPKGRIEFVTSAAVSREGNRPVFCVLDQTEEWKPSNGGRKLAATLRRNLGKTGGASIESPNAYEPGAESVAEDSAEYWRRIMDGTVRSEGLLYDHREAPPETDITDHDSLISGLRYAYGDSAIENGGWVDLERIVSEIWDPATDPQDARRFYLNQVTHASDSWLSRPEWNACKVDENPVIPGDTITLGFDGSRGRIKGITDATALIGCRVSDGRLFEVGVWEQPLGPAGVEWMAPVAEINEAVDDTFKRYNVVGFLADPAKWEEWVSKWEAKYGPKLKVKATASNPIEWWFNRPSLTVRALEQFHTAVVERELSHGGDWRLSAHVLNARRRVSRVGTQISKEHPESGRKIDAAIAAVLAWEARITAIGKGLNRPKSRKLHRW